MTVLRLRVPHVLSINTPTLLEFTYYCSIEEAVSTLPDGQHIGMANQLVIRKTYNHLQFLHYEMTTRKFSLDLPFFLGFMV